MNSLLPWPILVDHYTLDSARQAETRLREAVELLKNTPTGLTLSNPELYPYTFTQPHRRIVAGAFEYTLSPSPLVIDTSGSLRRLMEIGPEAVYQKPTEDIEGAFQQWKYLVEDLTTMRTTLLQTERAIADAEKQVQLQAEVVKQKEQELAAAQNAVSAALLSLLTEAGSVGHNPVSILTINLRLLVDSKTKIESGMPVVEMPVRGHLVEKDGQTVLELLTTGGSVPKTVPVLNAERDEATGLDRITVPAVGGAPSLTILINPAPATARPSNTGNQSQIPMTPVHTGTEVIWPDKIVTITTPAGNTTSLQDFIYWRPDASGTGVEPVYVMLSSPYGETNAKGKYSGRDYNTDKAGGAIQNLDWKSASIDRAGVDKVKLHTGRFESTPENAVMLDRLEKILKGELQVTDIDKRYYTHEIRELERYRNLGIKDGEVPENKAEVWNNTHTATLEDYQLSSDETLLYTPEALNSQE
ncbi:TPA: S-type pyocin domain-containing protein [Yersinia enterocolitica]